MSWLIARLRKGRAGTDEAGMTLVEMLVSMTILGIALASVYGVLASVQTGFNVESDRSVNATQVGVAMQQLEKEIQSAEAFAVCLTADCRSLQSAGVLCPASGSASDCYLVVYTQTNATTRQVSSPGPNAPFSCVEWRVAQVASSPAQYALQSRRWQPDWENNPSVLATGWRNVTDPMPTVSASFQIVGTPAFGGRLLQVSVTVNQQPANWNRTSPLTVTRQLMGANVLSTSTTSGNPNPCIPPNGTVPY
jgi:prepilin-type N-terminal cleavage/methylation domain-containing protein